MRKKGLAIGTSDFKKIIEKNAYYFDKAKFVEEIVHDIATVKLFTRPRRLGKTLNMTMLKYFFDVKDKEKNRELFKGLYIENADICLASMRILLIGMLRIPMSLQERVVLISRRSQEVLINRDLS